jgi:hypothetical protein
MLNESEISKITFKNGSSIQLAKNGDGYHAYPTGFLALHKPPEAVELVYFSTISDAINAINKILAGDYSDPNFTHSLPKGFAESVKFSDVD